MSKDENGLYKYSTVIWSDVKKSAKSSVAAAVAANFAITKEYAEIYIIANDLKQADSRVAMYFRRALELNPRLRKLYRNKGYRTMFTHNHSYVEAIPIDPSGEAGSNADLIVTSELWGAHEEAKQRMFAELTLSPTKFGKSMRWIESYAGYTDESKLLYSLYDAGVLNGVRLWDEPMPTMMNQDMPLEAYVNREARIFCLWNTIPRLPWQTKEYYNNEAAMLDPNEFRRIHRNEWVTSKDTFIPMEWWDACRDNEIPPIKGLESIVLALDAGVSHANFALVGVSRHPTQKEDTILRFSKRWVPPKGGKINFEGTKEDPGPELFLLELCKRYNIVEIAYDPYQLEDMAGRLRRRGVAWFRPFSQQTTRMVADSQFRTRIRERRIHHQGDNDMREHIGNCDAKVDLTGERNIRLVPKAENKYIDLAVAYSMADYEAMRLNL